MFSLMSVCLSVHRRQGPHVTITHDVLDIIVQPPPHPLGIRPWPPKPQPPLASDIWWSSLKTCSNLFIWGHPQNNIWWWSLVWFTNVWYISYWNAFLCSSKDLNGNLFGWSVIKDTYPINFELHTPHFASQFETRNSLGNDKAVWERFLRSINCSLLPQSFAMDVGILLAMKGNLKFATCWSCKENSQIR